ncbi:MAG: aminoacyl-tRNA hydrolase [Candidatus Pacebacteria bacterium]|nr:aminoacyl-tRNA hydrolase [Candidatus Paceibacterota bacterium]
MKFLIVGLGNPGEKYTQTRHNVGFLVMDSIIDKESWQKSSRAQAFYAQKNIGEYEVEYLKPQTFMNNSGISVRYEVKKHLLSGEHIIVVCDDIDLPFGKIRLSKNRGSGGHNGLKSIMSQLGMEDFIRVRIGVGMVDDLGTIRKPKGGLFTSKTKAVANFVLKNFSPEEQKHLDTIFEKVNNAIEAIVMHGIECAMNEYN